MQTILSIKDRFEIIRAYILLSAILLLAVSDNKVSACSMYKITVDGKTIVGCNQDAWRTTTNIWFEVAANDAEYGTCFTGSRKVGPNQYAPQSGMNEVGLAFSRLVAYYPKKPNPFTDRLKITNEVDYLSDILHKCGSIDEVKAYIEQYDHSIFFDDVYIYIESSGKYLIVEPYELIEGNDSNYVLSNFCPSITDNQQARKQERYKNGEDYIRSNTVNTSLEYSRSLSDTMSVCRSRNGDGTLLTSIWDTQNGLVNLYFYHDYETTIQYNISEELAKGNHLIKIPELFPKNLEFQRLKDYKTPFNFPLLRVALAATGCFIVMLSIMFFISFIRKRLMHHFNLIKLFFAGINILLFSYLFILATNINIFYFDAPYEDYGSKMISLSSYIPFLLILLIAPLSYYNIRFLKSNRKSILLKSSLICNNLIYLLLVVGFGYWGLFDVLN